MDAVVHHIHSVRSGCVHPDPVIGPDDRPELFPYRRLRMDVSGFRWWRMRFDGSVCEHNRQHGTEEAVHHRYGTVHNRLYSMRDEHRYELVHPVPHHRGIRRRHRDHRVYRPDILRRSEPQVTLHRERNHVAGIRSGDAGRSLPRKGDHRRNGLAAHLLGHGRHAGDRVLPVPPVPLEWGAQQDEAGLSGVHHTDALRRILRVLPPEAVSGLGRPQHGGPDGYGSADDAVSRAGSGRADQSELGRTPQAG